MGSLNLQSPAKINLYLRVLNKRPDGFHDLDSAFQLIDLFDNIEMSDIDSSEVIIQCEPSIIKSEDNIILKAINDLKKDYKIDNGIEIKLKKNIPIGAGLGGGSSNAASVLLGLNKMWGLDISYSEMVKRGKSLGADVPFFIHGENAYVSGIGDQFRSKKFNQEKYVLICPNISISTKEMFEYYSKGINLPLAENMDMQNSFLVSVLYKYPEINLFYKKNISSFDIHLTGTGSTMFIPYKHSDKLKKIMQIIPINWRFFLTEAIQYSPLRGMK
jgi:4-diphosphocytidyl-2-C-methyl-D-erythritol kinase|tara:strand:- start:12830 stop:13648 length:819 start_codon:yes stop_codon:yes gene_type:complete